MSIIEETARRSGQVLNVSLVLVWVANGVLGTFLALYVSELGGSLLEVSLVAALPNLAALMTSAPWGSLSDRFDSRKLFIIIGNASLGVTILAFAFLREAVPLLSIYGVGSIFIAASVPALSAYVTTSSSSSGRSLGTLLAVQSLGWAVGSLAGGFLYESGRIQWAFWMGGLASFLGCIVFGLWFKEPPLRHNNAGKPSIGGYLRVMSTRGVLPACIVGLILMVGVNAFSALFSVYLVIVLTGSKVLLGESMALSAVLGAIVSPFVGRLNDRIGRKPVLILGGVIYSAFFLAIVFLANPTIVAILWILPVYPFVYTSLSALISDFTSVSERGVGMGILNASLSLGRVVGPLVGGIIATVWDIQEVAVIAMLLGLAASLYSAFFIVEGRTPIPSSPRPS